MKVVLLGPPGAGKGTQAKSICNKYSIPHISTGDIFRRNISEKTLLGIEAKKYIDKGQLVPDELTINIVEQRLMEDECSGGYLLDGFPRTVNQAEALDRFLKDNSDQLDKVLLIAVPNDYILDRMTGRRVCPNCGASYHIRYNPPKQENQCDICESAVVQRKDDTEQTVKERLEVYARRTQPLIEYYKQKGKLSIVDGTASINDVFQNICGILGSDK